MKYLLLLLFITWLIHIIHIYIQNKTKQKHTREKRKESSFKIAKRMQYRIKKCRLMIIRQESRSGMMIEKRKLRRQTQTFRYMFIKMFEFVVLKLINKYVALSFLFDHF